MPKGQPTPDQIVQREISFFSIDTNVLEGKGYDFKRGALNLLHRQRPSWMVIQLSEVVEREVLDHRMRDLNVAHEQLQASLKYLHRKASLDTNHVIEALSVLNATSAAKKNFNAEMKAFVDSLGGAVLPTEGENLARELFDRYFTRKSPFEVIKDKKSEFPDAAALLTLEHYAKKVGTMGLLISNDKGWHAFAAESERLFCVSSLAEFTSITEKIGVHIAALETKVREALADRSSQLFSQMEVALKDHAESANWSVNEIDSSLRVEAEVYQAELVTCDPLLGTLQGWLTEEDSPCYINEFIVTAQMNLHISAEFFHWDSIDHEEFSAGHQEFEVRMEIEVNVFISSSGHLVADPVDTWDSEFEIADDTYSVVVGSVELDLSDRDYEE